MYKILGFFKKWVAIPIFLACISIFLTLIFFLNSDLSPNTLSANHAISDILQKDNKIYGIFKAQHDYLGVVMVPFNISYKLNELSVFRIKEQYASDWYHVATISANQYYAIPNYTFGLPVIKDSKNKTYYFEVELLDHNPLASFININKKVNYFKSNYSPPKYILLENKSMLFNFIKNKALYYLNDSSASKVMLVYSISIITYLLYILLLESKLKKYIKLILKPSLIFLSIFFIVDIFVFRKYSDKTVIYLGLSWIILMIAYKYDIVFSFFFASVFLFFCLFLVWANMGWVAEKSAIWAFMFLVLGTLQGTFQVNPYIKGILKFKFFKQVSFIIRKIILTFDRQVISLNRLLILLVRKRAEKIFNDKPVTLSDWIYLYTKIIVLIVIISGFFIVLIVISTKIYQIYLVEDHKRMRLTMNPTIETVEPYLVYKATNIVIYGNNFGWNIDNTAAVFVDGIKPDGLVWTNSMIYFSVPVNWSLGKHNIWIERNIVWDDKKEIAKSHVFQFKILPVTGSQNADDDLYFKQLKNLKKETLKLNGYN